ncbi:hypothetical protein IJH72_00885 [Candidatus Saccharibacteria bacterium]|nr:hypothetical protein [Candidatus Saccharibacteria bacterium]
MAVVAIVVAVADACSVDVAIVHIVGIVPSRTPEVAVRTKIVPRTATIEVARQRSKDFLWRTGVLPKYVVAYTRSGRQQSHKGV